MPRNSSGTYTLPTGNPVVTGTTIQSDWANSTLTDLKTEMTDSLSRSGKGAMTAPLQADNGTAGAPGVTFDGDTNTGMWNPSADVLRLTAAGIDILEVGKVGAGASYTRSTAPVRLPDGAKAAPALTFTTDQETGFYLPSAGTAALAVGGNDAQTWDSSGSSVIGNLTVDDGGHSNVLTIAPTSPASNAGFSKTLTPYCVPKAAGHIKTNGSGGVTVVSGQNISAVALGINGIEITFATALGNANYVAIFNVCIPTTGVGAGLAFLQHNMNASDQTKVYVNMISSAYADIDPSTSTNEFSFVIFGG
jgi:hypothetical protein